MKTYTFHQDAGHGWLEVDRQDLVDLNIIDKITSFSYQKGNKVFLEEDCDYSTFWDALNMSADKDFKLQLEDKLYKGDAPMRSMDSFHILTS
jgi:hypothetical protein